MFTYQLRSFYIPITAKLSNALLFATHIETSLSLFRYVLPAAHSNFSKAFLSAQCASRAEQPIPRKLDRIPLRTRRVPLLGFAREFPDFPIRPKNLGRRLQGPPAHVRGRTHAPRLGRYRGTLRNCARAVCARTAKTNMAPDCLRRGRVSAAHAAGKPDAGDARGFRCPGEFAR